MNRVGWGFVGLGLGMVKFMGIFVRLRSRIYRIWEDVILVYIFRYSGSVVICGDVGGEYN